MFVSDRFASDSYDCFIVGSGPAGMTTALTLAAAGRRVLVFESGDESRARSELANSVGYGQYSGEYWNNHWIRVLGGTSRVWSGWCVTHRDLDLDNPGVAARWPIRRTDLLPYWRLAAPILDHDPAFIDFETPLLPGFSYRPASIAEPTQFGDKYRETLGGNHGVDVALGRTIVGLHANDARSVLTAIDYVDHTLDFRRRMPVSPAQSLVLAAGGLGNAQLLLQPPEGGGVPVGNESGQAGRFLMEHPQFNLAGECVIDEPLDRYWPPGNRGAGVHAVVADRALSLEHGLYACSLQCSRKTTDHDMARLLSSRHERPFYHYEMTARAEMQPSPDNRVMLTAERDRWGMYRPAARCVLDARDFRNVERTLRVFGETLIRLGKGRVRVNNDHIYKDVSGQGHTLGTTRMGEDPATSVVDADCRVHGYANLFVAGSSVFPAGGYANPTLTIVALALRLAERIARRGA
jgi:choline dehydrogenase-like flavoprotein